MNIGVVTTWFERGAGYVSKAYVKTLAKQHRVFVYARGGETYGKGDPNWDLPFVTFGPRWYNPVFPLDSAMSRSNFWKWIRQHNIAVLLFNEQRHIGLVKSVRRCGIICGTYVDYYTKETVKDFAAYDFLVCNTRRHYSVFKDHPCVFYVPWGTDTTVFVPRPSPLSFDEGVVFFHNAGYGAANCRKGTDLVVEAFQRVTGHARLIIHSQTAPESFGRRTMATIARDRRIRFMHKTVAAPGLYHMGHVYVYPSRLDGIGLSLPEALSTGLPAITTDCAPMNEFVEDGYNGLLVRVARVAQRWDRYYWPETEADVADLSQKMQLYVNDKSLIREHSVHARSWACEYGDWSKNSKLLPQYFSACAASTRGVHCPATNLMSWVLRDCLVLLTFLLSRPAQPLWQMLRRVRFRHEKCKHYG